MARVSPSAIASPSNASRSYAVLTRLIERGSELDWKLDLQLMHHGMTQTKYLLTEHDEDEAYLRQWRTEVPRIAFECDYVLHSLLGFCALHMAHLEPSKAPMLRMYAVEHYDRALMFNNEDMALPSSENAAARFLFSRHMSLFAYAILPSIAPIDGIVKIFSMIRRNSTTISEVWCWVTQCPIGPMVTKDLQGLRRGPWRQPHLPDGAEYALDALNFMLDNEVMQPEARFACEVALAELKQIFHTIQHESHACNASTITSFPQSSADTFPALIRQRAPQALVILAHYCELLNILDARWWMEGWGRRLLQDILTSVDEPWRRWIERPIQTVLLKGPSEMPVAELERLF